MTNYRYLESLTPEEHEKVIEKQEWCHHDCHLYSGYNDHKICPECQLEWLKAERDEKVSD